MDEKTIIRFAVGTLGNWQEAATGLRDLRLRGLDTRLVSLLALKRVFSIKAAPKRISTDKAFSATAKPAPLLQLQELAFPCEQDRLCCTRGPLADCLNMRRSLGAPTLQQALGYWLVPRHAAHLAQAATKGRILMWIQVLDADDESHACRSLLAHSSDAVGVHDLSLAPL
jgi:hypothetical protein